MKHIICTLLLLTACGGAADPTSPDPTPGPGQTTLRIVSVTAGATATTLVVESRNVGGAGVFRVVGFDDPRFTFEQTVFTPRIVCETAPVTVAAWTTVTTTVTCAPSSLALPVLWLTLEVRLPSSGWERTACLPLFARPSFVAVCAGALSPAR